MKKLLVVATEFPPQVAGTATILGNLFRQLSREEFALLGYRGSADQRVDPANTVDCAKYYATFPHTMRRLSPGLFQEHRVRYLAVPGAVLAGLRAMRREGCQAIFAAVNVGSFAWAIAAYFLHLLSRKPLYLYGIDLWAETIANSRLERTMARLFEERVFRAATKVFVISQALQEHYRKKYGLEVELLPIPVELPEGGPCSIPEGERLPVVLFTGSVYSACADAVADVSRAIASMPDGHIELFLATATLREQLASLGIEGPHVTNRFLSKEETYALQRKAAALLLPQAFNSFQQDVVDTLFPAKTVEYLVSGTPILVHAPAGCQIARYARENGFALVVDRPDTGELRAALTTIMEDRMIRDRLVTAAWETARRHHDARAIASKLRDSIGE